MRTWGLSCDESRPIQELFKLTRNRARNIVLLIKSEVFLGEPTSRVGFDLNIRPCQNWKSFDASKLLMITSDRMVDTEKMGLIGGLKVIFHQSCWIGCGHHTDWSINKVEVVKRKQFMKILVLEKCNKWCKLVNPILVSFILQVLHVCVVVLSWMDFGCEDQMWNCFKGNVKHLLRDIVKIIGNKTDHHYKELT